MYISESEIYEQLVSFLKRFFHISHTEFEPLKAKLSYRQFPARHLLTREGEAEQYLYFTGQGLIHQYFYKGKEMVTTDLVCEGTITGSVSSFLSGKPSHYFLETMEPTAALCIRREDLQQLYDADVRWQRFGRILITHFFLQQELHLLDNIRYTIRERIAHFAEEYPGLLKRVPQRRLASYLNIKPETFTRLKPLIASKRKKLPAKPGTQPEAPKKSKAAAGVMTPQRMSPAFFDYAVKYFQQFMPLSRAEMESLMQYCEFREFGKKEVVVREGEVDDYLNMVVRGLVRKYVKVDKGEVILQLATEGHVVHSELSYLTRTPSQVILETLEPTLLLSMQYEKMEEALLKHPQGEMLGRKILEGMYIKKDERKYAWQAMDVRQRFLDYVERHPHMLQRVPQKYLASYLNIKPETFSRLKHLTRSK